MERKTNEQSPLKSVAIAAIAALVLAVTASGCATSPVESGEMLHIDQGTGTE